jgi:protein-disulfide isomerase
MRSSYALVAGCLVALTLTAEAAPKAPAVDPVAALVDGQPITVAEVEAKAKDDIAREDAQYAEAQRRAANAHRATLQALREATLEGMIRDRTLAAEATATGQTADAIVAAHASPEPTDEEMRAYYKANATPSAPPYDQVIGVIRERLQAEGRQKAEAELVRSLRERHAVEWRLARERLTVSTDGPSRGPAQATVTLVEFADFQCPYCGRLESVLKPVLARYPDSVKFVYRQLPIPQLHPSALLAAQASVCADRQGQFWAVHDALFALFTGKGTLDGNTVATLGEAAGLDATAFGECLSSGQANDVITHDVAEADQLGVEGTPALFLNGRPLRGGVSEDTLRDAIDEELARLARARG